MTAVHWLFDLGNTRLKAAPLLRDGRIGEVCAWAHADACFDDALAAALPARIDVAHVASVADEGLRLRLLQLLSQRCTRVGLASTQAVFDGLRIAYADPRKLGVDRFLALLGARSRQAGPALVVGVGTAATLDLVDAGGQHRGGRILPSPRVMREALQARTPRLPADGGAYVEFADDTADALASGCEGALLGVVERSLRAAELLLGAQPALLLHGGGATALQARLPAARLHPTLVLDGLARWAAAETASA